MLKAEVENRLRGDCENECIICLISHKKSPKGKKVLFLKYLLMESQVDAAKAA